MRHVLIAAAAALALGAAVHAPAQVSVQFGFPGVQIGIDVPTYPHLVRVPGYPVYYDSQGDSNYFFYDGLYWVYWNDSWYSSSWYNGPWHSVGPDYVPLYVLRVPVRYYRRPPSYFRGWRADAPPRWGDHWGHGWESQRSGWDRWNHSSVPSPAPLPVYQRQYSGDRYPRTVEQERSIRTPNYRYQPREPISQQHLGPYPVTSDARPVPQQSVQEGRPAPQQSVHEGRPSPQAHEQKAHPEQGKGQGNREKDKEKDKEKEHGHERSER